MFGAILGQTEYDSIVKEISICDAVHNRWSLLYHITDGYDESNEKAMSKYDIHGTKLKCYNFEKSLRHRLSSAPTTSYNAPDKLD